jgi:hypothetical protein
MKYGINENGINYFLVGKNEFFCTYYSSGLNVEVTLKNVIVSYIEKLTLAELINFNKILC